MPFGSDNVTALIIDAEQKALNAPGIDLATYDSVYINLTDYLRVIAASPAPRLEKQLYAPADELLARISDEYKEIKPIMFFSQDKPGIYERLDEGQRLELIDRISREGEVAAFLWAFQMRPDIFRSADFIPRSVTENYWSNYVNR